MKTILGIAGTIVTTAVITVGVYYTASGLVQLVETKVKPKVRNVANKIKR